MRMHDFMFLDEVMIFRCKFVFFNEFSSLLEVRAPPQQAASDARAERREGGVVLARRGALRAALASRAQPPKDIPKRGRNRREKNKGFNT